MKIQFLSRRGHFQLLCKELKSYSINCEIIDNKKSRNALALPSQYYINKIDSDLLVTHNPYYGLYGGKKAKKAGKINSLIFRLKADHWTEEKSLNISYKHKLGYILKRYQYNESINDVDFIISISDYMKKIALKHGLDKKIYLMYNGVDIKRFHERKFEPNYKSELLCVMNFNIPEKIVLLEEFFKQYYEMNLNYKITILGNGEFINKVKSTVKRLGLSDKVIFKGYVNDIEHYYSNCDIVIHPSSLESFGMVFLEAGASAKPCVATNVGATSEILVNNKTGYVTDTVYEFVDKVDSLMSDPEKRLMIGKNAEERVYEFFRWGRIAQTFINILKEECLLD